VLYVVAFLLVAASTLNMGRIYQAMAGSIHLVLPVVPAALAALVIVALTLILLVFLSYNVYAKYHKMGGTCAVLIHDCGAPFQCGLGEALRSPVVPAIKLDAGCIHDIGAILGTTISPYMFFWQANMEVRRKIASRSPHRHADEAPTQAGAGQAT